jgi:hypothetical protein
MRISESSVSSCVIPFTTQHTHIDVISLTAGQFPVVPCHTCIESSTVITFDKIVLSGQMHQGCSSKPKCQ